MNNTKRNYALISGLSLIAMAVAAGYSYGYVYNNLVISGNPIVTVKNLKSATTLFGSGVVGWLVILITDILVAWSLYHYFSTINNKISLATGGIRIIYSAILAFAIFHLVSVWQLLHVVNPDAIVLVNYFDDFERYWSLGLILFGFHLIGLGYLTLYSNKVPKWIGLLLYVAGVSYTIIHGVKAIIPEALNIIATAEMILGAPMAIAELGLAIWLIWKGGK